MVISEIINNPKLLRNNNNKKLMLDLVSIKGTMLEYASNDLKNDIEVVMAAFKNDYHSIVFASEELKKIFISEMIKLFSLEMIEEIQKLKEENEELKAENRLLKENENYSKSISKKIRK